MVPLTFFLLLNSIITKKEFFRPITKVWIEDGCISCEISSETCPEVFEIPEDHDINIVKENVDFSQYEEEIKKAADECPADVIKYEEQD